MSALQPFDKDGNPITMAEWAVLFENVAYKRVAETWVGEIRISTVWIGISGIPGETFETMVFYPDDRDYCQRYTHLDDAQAGHEETVTLVRATEGIPTDGTAR